MYSTVWRQYLIIVTSKLEDHLEVIWQPKAAQDLLSTLMILALI